MWDLPGPGLKPVSPALAGGFLTTAPPGESHKKECFCLLDGTTALTVHPVAGADLITSRKTFPDTKNEQKLISLSVRLPEHFVGIFTQEIFPNNPQIT